MGRRTGHAVDRPEADHRERPVRLRGPKLVRQAHRLHQIDVERDPVIRLGGPARWRRWRWPPRRRAHRPGPPGSDRSADTVHGGDVGHDISHALGTEFRVAWWRASRRSGADRDRGPLRRNAAAIARPMPRPPPVTRTRDPPSPRSMPLRLVREPRQGRVRTACPMPARPERRSGTVAPRDLRLDRLFDPVHCDAIREPRPAEGDVADGALISSSEDGSRTAMTSGRSTSQAGPSPESRRPRPRARRVVRAALSAPVHHDGHARSRRRRT